MDIEELAKQSTFEIDRICLNKCFPNMTNEISNKHKICLGIFLFLFEKL